MTGERMSAADYNAQIARPRGTKFGNVPTVVDGIRFDSKAEARYFKMLRLREAAGEVAGIEHQKPFVIPGANGEAVCTYVADFAFYDHVAGRERVVDVKGGKGTQTALFKLKAKLMRSQLGIVVEVEERA